jgi:hypothetical protein
MQECVSPVLFFFCMLVIKPKIVRSTSSIFNYNQVMFSFWARDAAARLFRMDGMSNPGLIPARPAGYWYGNRGLFTLTDNPVGRRLIKKSRSVSW